MAGLYAIDNFSTTAKMPGSGGYGPVIVLSKDAVEAFLEIRESTELVPRLKNDMLQRLNDSLLPQDCGFARVSFFPNSWFLVGLQVGKECACFTLSSGAQECLKRGQARTLRYTAHNIFNREQVGAILSVWLMWFNWVIDLTDDLRQPFTLS